MMNIYWLYRTWFKVYRGCGFSRYVSAKSAWVSARIQMRAMK